MIQSNDSFDIFMQVAVLVLPLVGIIKYLFSAIEDWWKVNHPGDFVEETKAK